MSLSVIILAAGKGTRMYSDKAKVLHEIGGKSMIMHVIDLARKLKPVDIHVVIGHQAEKIQSSIVEQDINWVLQTEQLGTGHAVQQAIDHVKGDRVLVLYGDVPLLQAETMHEFSTLCNLCKLSIVTAMLNDPTGYGRIVRNSKGDIQAIVEQSDADKETLQIREGNSGILSADTDKLKQWLGELKNTNEQGEYYLTDCIEIAVNEDLYVGSLCVENELEVLGVNNQVQLEMLEREYQRCLANNLLLHGVNIKDKNRIDIRGKLNCGKDVVIDINCVFEGNVTLGNGVAIGPNCLIKDTTIDDNSIVLSNCVIENSVVANDCSIGPFARLRPGANMLSGSKAGNFVEIKNANIGLGSKVNHLTYVGDTDVGKNVNIGAGTITCNYDGANKHRTTIGDDVFIGSNTALVAPVKIESEATIGAGSTITKKAPKGELTLARSKQITLKGWNRPVKENK